MMSRRIRVQNSEAATRTQLTTIDERLQKLKRGGTPQAMEKPDRNIVELEGDARHRPLHAQDGISL